MKTTDFYKIKSTIKNKAIKELKTALKAHGGEFRWFDEDGEELEDYDYPVVLAATSRYEGKYENVIIRGVWLDEHDYLFFDAVTAEYECEVNIEAEDIEDLYYIVDFIPDTEEVNNVTSSPLNVGQEVFWNDPEGKTSGVYTVTMVPEIFEKDSVILISNGISEAEVTIDELWIQAK